MKLAHLAAAGILVTALIGGTAVAAGATTTTSSSSATSTCLPANHDDVWPVAVDGTPVRDPGVRVWHDATGWHVRVTHNSLHDRTFSGEIITRGEVVAVHATRLEKNDYLKLAPGKHGVAFRFNNYGGTDGFDFVTKCAPSLEFGFTSDGHRVPTAHISLGRDAHHPSNNPFVIRRTA